jgi:RNA polymerase sigma-70 factor (ECF subfamily)
MTDEARELDPHFFRHESGRLVAALARVFGLHNLALAEDVAQDTLVRALEVWKLHGVPEQPSAWLLAAAKNRAIDVLRREKTARTYSEALGRHVESEWTLRPTIDELFDDRAVRDDELRMMFSICHPRLSEDAQVALVLHIVSGLSVDEIAAAFFASHAAIEKRLTRAKHTLADTRSLFELTPAQVAERLGAVESAIYLLFNEGYHGASAESAVREDLCREALRLVTLLAEHPVAGAPSTLALAALLHLHAARLPGRVAEDGRLLSLFDQDRGRWDRALAGRGVELLERSAAGDVVSEFHLEAAIASLQMSATARETTDWAGIVTLYDRLMEMRPSPVVALSRAIAIAERSGPRAGTEALEAIEGKERLASYPFHEAAWGELLSRSGDAGAARARFEAAAALARSPMEKRYFEDRAAACGRAAIRTSP